MNNTPKLLEVENLSIDMQSAKINRRLLHNITFSLEEGDILGLMGESGSGKTLLASSLCGLLTPPIKISGGFIKIAGEKMNQADKKAWRQKRGRDIMMIFQSASSALNPYMKIGKQIAEAIEEIHHISYKSALQKSEMLLEKVGLNKNLKDAYPFQLSGGMQQRVLIAIAIGLCPKILIADEPTTGLDPVSKLHVLDLIKRVNQEHGVSILFISHDLKAVSYIAEKICVMHNGHIIEQGEVKQIFDSPKTLYMKQTSDALKLMGRN